MLFMVNLFRCLISVLSFDGCFHVWVFLLCYGYFSEFVTLWFGDFLVLIVYNLDFVFGFWGFCVFVNFGFRSLISLTLGNFGLKFSWFLEVGGVWGWYKTKFGGFLDFSEFSGFLCFGFWFFGIFGFAEFWWISVMLPKILAILVIFGDLFNFGYLLWCLILYYLN